LMSMTIPEGFRMEAVSGVLIGIPTFL